MTMDRASATRCCWPPESSPGLRDANEDRPTVFRPDLDPILQLLPPHSLEPQPEGDVFENGEVRKKGIGLKDEADGPLIGGDARDVSAVEMNMPRDRRQKTGNRPHRRGLAAARRAKQGDELPLTYR